MREVRVLAEPERRSESGAANRLLCAVYDELRLMAAAKLARERGCCTLEPAALVHEAWLRLGADHQVTWHSRAHFFSAAAEAMRRILIERARRRARVRHGAGQYRVAFEEITSIPAEASAKALLALNEALEQLAVEAADHAELVKLRYFVGLTLPEAAEVLGISESTAKRRWAFARAWLLRELQC